VLVSTFGDAEAARAGAALRRSRVPASREILLWSWPAGWRFAVGKRVARGTTLPAFVPVDGAELDADGRRWRCLWTTGTLLPVPAWLAETLGGQPSKETAGVS
jgi:hypothetical protein